MTLIRTSEEACKAPVSFSGAAPLPPPAMVPQLLTHQHEARVHSMPSGKCVPDDRSIGLSPDEAFTCCLVKSMAASPRRDGRKERCLGQDRSRQHHPRSWKVCQSLTSWRSLGIPLLVASLGEDPQGVSWRRVALSLSEAAKAGLRQHLLLID